MPETSVALRQKTIIRRQFIHHALLSDVHPVLDKIYRRRGVKDSQELDYSLSKLSPPDGLSGVEEAAAIIVDAIAADASILIVGDYDTDGATSCALGYLSLKAMGARHVAYLAPDRFKFGYGLSEGIVEYLSKTAPDLVITVDNGISSVAGVKLAKEKGISVIVTDHHLPGDELPPADSIVNPQLPGNQFISKNLAGVGVMFYVATAVRKRLVQEGWFEREGIANPNMADYLDLVALGTVADMVTLDHNNRILVTQGLRRINSGRCRFGIKALLESGGRRIGQVTERDLGFIVAPRLNAAGRLDDITVGIKCLTSDDRNGVVKHVEQLESLNQARRELQQTMLDEAMGIVEEKMSELPDGAPCYCLYKEDWHQGVVGLVASRIVELTGKPTFAFAPASDGTLRGSGRSVNGLNIRDALAEIDTEEPQLLLAFGGHAMAAGLTIEELSYGKFSNKFTHQVVKVLGSEGAHSTISTDGELDTMDLTTAEAIKGGGPWGQGFAQPVFDGIFVVREWRVVGDAHLRLRLESEDSNIKCGGIFFGYFRNDEAPPIVSHKYRIVYRFEVNEFQNKKSAEMAISHLEPA